MKILNIINLILFAVNIKCMSQINTGYYHFDKQIIYQYEYVKDSTDRGKSDKLEMLLLCNDSTSLFVSYKNFSNDSIYLDQITHGITTTTGVVNWLLNTVNPTRYYILKKGECIETIDAINGFDQSLNQEFGRMVEKANDFNWSIKADTLTILGFNCQKAEVVFGGRKWIAWFTTEIPIMDGPYKFCGLPGLITKIEDSQKFFQFTMKDIRALDRKLKILIRPDILLKDIDKNKFFRLRRKYQDNMYENTVLYLADDPVFTEEKKRSSKKRADEIIKKNNNWIERIK